MYINLKYSVYALGLLRNLPVLFERKGNDAIINYHIIGGYRHMARIMYDRYLTDADCSVNITNADTEYLATTVPESFINPPIKMRFLSTGGKSFEELCLDAVGDDEIEISHEDTLRMVRGELPGWRLVGVQFTASGGFSAFYANEHPIETLAPSEGKCSYTFASGVSFFFVERDCLEVELEVDYDDGLPTRRYIGKVTYDDEVGVSTVLIEFLGKRKIQKMQFSENEYGNERIPGHVCHITEY